MTGKERAALVQVIAVALPLGRIIDGDSRRAIAASTVDQMFSLAGTMRELGWWLDLDADPEPLVASDGPEKVES
jgi:hypothetical protein